jgi:hypothetical protein
MAPLGGGTFFKVIISLKLFNGSRALPKALSVGAFNFSISLQLEFSQLIQNRFVSVSGSYIGNFVCSFAKIQS